MWLDADQFSNGSAGQKRQLLDLGPALDADHWQPGEQPAGQNPLQVGSDAISADAPLYPRARKPGAVAVDIGDPIDADHYLQHLQARQNLPEPLHIGDPLAGDW